MKATWKKNTLQFKRPAGTSRGTLKTKDTWYLKIESGDSWGVGECGMFRGLSVDDRPDFEEKLQWTCNHIQLGESQLLDELTGFPAIQIGVETAFHSLRAKDAFQIFPSGFVSGKQPITINGLVWMGDKAFMKQQISEKLKQGFNCIKMKIGAIAFETELALLKSIRSEFSPSEIELRVDANGAFAASEALEKLKILSDLQLHSIEQPIKQGQWQEMAHLCDATPLPIALDEELIGIVTSADKEKLLQTIQPQYIILKPTLVGGFGGSDTWIQFTEKHHIGWWITSALESNVGLNAIAQYTAIKNNTMPQGLGTGSLFTNNIASPLQVTDGKLHYNKNKNWDTSHLKELL
ncbi:o-succinylbenzoate synthase [Marinirhabdus gelatinilytica]|uniref:O-succinylbenzoate synthase n=1 Tax=Marinirhabdus gelatinilytica TaxID=1703343 RepID=A0A370QGP1_9FLAO|nr:o-succinylbenzoate synthase [Marinirhabdus gelatinilytica]RDK87240.1 o-succinylbenzoate synthase [Marinirhabdus gelatinilytica]